VTLFVVINPIGVLPVFLALVGSLEPWRNAGSR
jgi:small neutral amino acid transporter SnatA (MarC family)